MLSLLVARTSSAAAAEAQPAPPAAPWAELSVTGAGINPARETWRFGLSSGGTLYVVRTSGNRASPAISMSLTRSSSCPGLMARMRELASVQREPRTGAPAPADGLDYRLDVISSRPFAGVRGPLHLVGDDLSPLAGWTRRLALTLDRCSGRSRRRLFRRPAGPAP